jgi:hypothetical protein
MTIESTRAVSQILDVGDRAWSDPTRSPTSCGSRDPPAIGI